MTEPDPLEAALRRGFAEPDHPVWKVVNWFPPTELGQQALVAYERDLSALLPASRGQWVAYHGGQQIGFGPSNARLYDEALSRGFSPAEIVICQIEPLGGKESSGTGMVAVGG
jgi:hypothetical protein